MHPNDFIQIRIKDEKEMTIIKIRGLLVDILLDIAPGAYRLYVITNCKGIKQMMFQCKNSIYGTIKASLLYYKKFRKSLEDEGYEFNPYGPCIANNIIKVSQMTVCFYVDNCKLIHKIPKVVGRMIIWLNK